MARENFYTLRRKSEELRRLAIQEIEVTEEQVELKRSYASAHTEDFQMGQLVGSPQDARCSYFVQILDTKRYRRVDM